MSAGPGPGPADVPVDWSVLEARYRGRPDSIGRIVGVAIESNREVPAQLRALAADGDVAELGRVAHSLCGAAQAIAAVPAGALAARLDQACRDGSPQAVALAAELAVAVEAVLAALNARD